MPKKKTEKKSERKGELVEPEGFEFTSDDHFKPSDLRTAKDDLLTPDNFRQDIIKDMEKDKAKDKPKKSDAVPPMKSIFPELWNNKK